MRNVSEDHPIRFSARLVVILAAALTTTGCIVPRTASMQSARTLEEDQVRITPYYTNVNYEEEPFSVNYGVLVGWGTGHNAEFQLRYERVTDPDKGYGYNYTSLGPKVSTANDLAAFLLPVGFIWEPGTDMGLFSMLQVEPGLILTAPAGRSLELSTSARVHVPLAYPEASWAMGNVGLSLGPDVSRWAIIPEVGLAVPLHAEASGVLVTYGVAIGYYPQRQRP